jgi:hypothetical protein
MSSAFGLLRDTIMHTGDDRKKDDRKDVQPCPVELWPETRPVVGRSRSFEPIYPFLGLYPVAVGDEGSGRRSSWPE